MNPSPIQPIDSARRRMLLQLANGSTAAALMGVGMTGTAHAALSDQDVTQGLRAALEKGVAVAVRQLGAADGFMGNDKIRITLPGILNDAARMLKALGQGRKVDDLILRMNRAAEAAVPLAKSALLDAVHQMSLTDARKILTGGETAATQFFAEKTRDPLTTKLLPTVQQALEKVGAVTAYNELAQKIASAGLLRQEDATLERHVTAKALDGVYWSIGEEERRIRQDPIGAGSDLLKKVFGG